MSFTVVKLLDRLNPTIITGGFVPRGTYDNATDYAVGDSVDYNGSSYVMFSNASAGTLPTDTDYWQVVANGGVSSVNTKSGIVVIDPDDLNDTSTTNKFTTAGDISKLAGIEALADVTDTTNVTAAGALMDSELTSLSGVKTLTLPDSTTISTFGATLTDDTDAATARTTLGLTAGGAGDIWVEKAGDTMSGNLVFSGSQKIIGGTGTTADLTFQTTSGVGATGADMHFLVGNNGNTEAMTILNSGFVGIGKIAPTVILDVVGASATTLTRTVAGAASPDSAIQIGLQETTPTNGGGPSFLFFGNNAAGTKSFIGRLSAIWENVAVGSETGAIAFLTRANSADTTASTERMRITSGGNIGIGTTAPKATLDIVHTNNAAGGIRLQDNLTNVTTKVGRIKVGHYTNAEEPVTAMLIFSTSVSNEINYGGGSGSENAATTLNFYTAANTTTTTGTIRMQVNSFGNVGIGTTGQLARLHVFGTADDEQLIVQGHSTQTAPLMQLWNSSSAILISFSGLGGAIFNEQGNDADFRVEGDTDANLLFVDASTDRVGVGLNNPAYKFDVNGDINVVGTSAYYIGGTAGVSGTFTSADAKTITVTKGIITSIV